MNTIAMYNSRRAATFSAWFAEEWRASTFTPSSHLSDLGHIRPTDF